MKKRFKFPQQFLWGAATSAYQIEGSPLADGAGASNWHKFSHTAGRTRDGHTGDLACDHYRRWQEDVALMASLGLRAYRFSISWSRIFPTGRGKDNPAGLAFYDRLVDSLLSAGIEPMVTLYHWDLPAALDLEGGWLNRDVSSWFGEYSSFVFRALDDRVRLWTTINEPWVVADAGYLNGVHAPGHRSVRETPVVTHNLLRAHATAVRAYRSVGRHEIGLVVNIEPKYPASDSREDREATTRADAYMNRQYLDPVFLGSYPRELTAIFGEAWPHHSSSDMALIRVPIDFLGVNYYTRRVTRHDPEILPLEAGESRVQGATYTATGWEVFPQGLVQTLTWIKQRYGDIPLYVTENGAALDEPATVEKNPFPDPDRVQYYRDHLLACRRAMTKGVDVRGYFAWSLLDNYEWSQGYSKRFGIVHVDFESQERTPKESALFYKSVILSRGAVLDANADTSEA